MPYIQRFSCPCRSAPQTAIFRKHGQSPGFPFMSGLPPQSEGAVPIHYCWERAAWAFQHRSTEKFPTLGSQNGSFTPVFRQFEGDFQPSDGAPRLCTITQRGPCDDFWG